MAIGEMNDYVHRCITTKMQSPGGKAEGRGSITAQVVTSEI